MIHLELEGTRCNACIHDRHSRCDGCACNYCAEHYEAMEENDE